MIKNYLLRVLVIFVLVSGLGSFNRSSELSGKNIGSGKSGIRLQTNRRTDKRIIFKWHPRNLERHYYKHRAEFPEYKTLQQYGNGALKFFRDPPPGTEFKHRPNGDRLFYYERGNIFGVTTKDGTIKTFFRPDRGRRYWKRQ